MLSGKAGSEKSESRGSLASCGAYLQHFQERDSSRLSRRSFGSDVQLVFESSIEGEARKGFQLKGEVKNRVCSRIEFVVL